MKHFLLILSALALVACQSKSRFEQLLSRTDQFDIAIINGTVYDGLGQADYQADLLIKDGTIAFIGDIDTSKISYSKLLDAKGKVVSPGFIDLHVHGNPLSTTSFQNFPAMGVTTIVLGQDGSHPGSSGLPAYINALETAELETNVALFAGHGSLRREAEIANEGTPSADQLNEMNTLLHAAFEAGAFGLSTGLEYVPGMYAQKDELTGLAKIVSANSGVLMSHVRNEDDDKVEASLQELFDLGEFCDVHISHIKVVYGKGEARGEGILELIDKQKQAGTNITADVYPYTASYTGIGILFPSWCKTNDQFQQVLKTRKKELEAYLEARVIKRNGPEATLFGSGKYAGKTLAQVAKEEQRTYVDVLMDIEPQGASGAYFIMDEALQDVFITSPDISIASDGSPTMLHPRGHGTQARIIQKYVEEQKSLSLEEAIYKMSGLPAKTIGLTNRGVLKEGNKADVLIFNPDNIHEIATYSNPHQLAEGFNEVIINGQIVRENGESSHINAGKLLKKKRN